MKHRLPLAVLSFFAVAQFLCAPPAYSQGDPANDARRKQFEADLKADKGGLATKVAQEMIRRTGRTYGDDKTRQERDMGALLEDIKGEPASWSKVAMFLFLDGKENGLTPDEKKQFKEFTDTLDKSLGTAKKEVDLKALSAMKTSIEGMKDKAGQDKFYENEQAMRDRWAAPSVVAGGSEKPPSMSDPIVKQTEIIRNFEAGDPYIYSDGAYQLTGPTGQKLRVMMRGKSDSPGGMYAYIADVSKSQDIRGTTFSLKPGGPPESFSLHGQNYSVTVETKAIPDPNGKYNPDTKRNEREDVVVHVFPAGEDGKPIGGKEIKKTKEKTTVQAGVLEPDDSITVGGYDGLAARALTKAVMGHVNEDGSRESYVAWMNGKRYYASLQGGVTAGLVFYPADEADEAYKAIHDKKEPAKFGSMMPRFVTDIWQCDSGVALPFSAKGSSIMDFGNGGYRYVYDRGSASWTLKKVSAKDIKDEAGAAAAKEKSSESPDGAAAPAAPAAPDAPAAAGPPSKPAAPGAVAGPASPPAGDAGQNGAIDSDWPATIADMTQVGDVNPVLKKQGASYRLYSDAAGLIYVLSAEDVKAKLSLSQLEERTLPTLGSQKTVLNIMGKALTADIGGRTLLFNAVKPMTKKNAPVTKDDKGNEVVDALQLDMVIDKPEGLPDLRVSDLAVLPAGLTLLKMTPKVIEEVMSRAARLSKESKKKIETIQAKKAGDKITIRAKLVGEDSPVIVWPEMGQPVKESKATSDAPPPATDASAGAGGNAYLVGATSIGAATQGPFPMEAELTAPVEGKDTTVYTDHVDKLNKVQLYCDKNPCPAKASEAHWFARWRLQTTKPGVAYSRLRYPTDVEDSGQNTPLVRIDPRMAIKALVLQDIGDKSNGLTIQPDRKHPNALEATMLASSEGNKHELFIGHVAFLGVEPPAKDHESAYLEAKKK